MPGSFKLPVLSIDPLKLTSVVRLYPVAIACCALGGGGRNLYRSYHERGEVVECSG